MITKTEIQDICNDIFSYNLNGNPQMTNKIIKKLSACNEKNLFHCNLIELYSKIKSIGYKKNLFKSDYAYDNFKYVDKLKEKQNIFWPNIDAREMKQIFDINFYILSTYYDEFCQIIADSINETDSV